MALLPGAVVMPAGLVPVETSFLGLQMVSSGGVFIRLFVKEEIKKEHAQVKEASSVDSSSYNDISSIEFGLHPYGSI